MAVRPLNSIAGFSTGDPAIVVVQANADVTTINLTANGISNLGPVSNLVLTGGSNGQFVQTDGNGNLTFATVDTSIISNGNSNVSIDTADGNVTVSVNGNANVAVFTDTGTQTQSLVVTGTSNLGPVGNLTLTGGTSGQFVQTDGNGNLSFATVDTSIISNGNSNVSIPSANGNVEISVAGNSNIAVFTGTGANVLNLDVQGISNLGNVGNVKITGGNADQYLKTDGLGNLVWSDVANASSNSAAPMPYLIPNGESYIVKENFQGLYSQPITIDGVLEVDGMLIEINDTIFANDNQILYSLNGAASGNTGFEFQYWSGNLSVPGNIRSTGNILPSADDTYDLGAANARWRNGYFGGNTIYLDTASIRVDENGYVVITNEQGGQFIVEGNTISGTNEIENGNSNVKVYENGNVATTIAGVANVMVVTSAGANLVGNLTTTGIKTDNLLYANGNPWDLGGNPGGSNTQLQFNNNGEFGGSANLAFDSVTNLLTLSGTANVTDLNVSGNGVINGNLSVNGNLIYINVTELSIEDPIINLQTGANGAPPISNSGKDVGTALNYYDTQARIAFMGWDTSNAEFSFGSQTSITNEVVTFTTLGNARAQTFKGNVEATTIAGTLTTASQPNVTSLGTLTSLSVSANATVGNLKLPTNGAVYINNSAGAAGQVLTSDGTNTYWSTRFYYGDTPPDFNTLNYGDIFFYIDNPNNIQRLYMWVTDGSSSYFYDFLPPSF